MHVLDHGTIVRVFGDPRPYILPDGGIDRSWEIVILSRPFPLPAPLPLTGHRGLMVRTVRCHRLVAPFLRAALLEIHAVPGLWATINDWGGCYAWRLQRGAKVPSTHCWALGPDMDVRDNPQGDPVGGGDVDIDPRVVSIMERHGFAWGGRFSGTRVDQMHFEASDELVRKIA